MAKQKGTFQFPANFDITATAALDTRVVQDSKADLIKLENWPNNGTSPYLYKGLIVDCGTDGVYRLIDETNALSADYSGWQRIDAGGLGSAVSYQGSVEAFTDLPTNAKNGDVYNVKQAFDNHPAGTNVIWDGSNWDPLGGPIDLSGYATSEDLSEVRTTANTNKSDIATLSANLGKTNENVANKVDKIDGESLIPAAKLALIETNETNIKNLSTRVGTAEGKINSIEAALSWGTI